MVQQPWKRYVTTLCTEAWHLDVRSTEEVVRCIEEIISSEGIVQATSVQVFLGVGVHTPAARGAAKTVCIQISSGDARRNTLGDTDGYIVEEVRHDPVH